MFRVSSRYVAGSLGDGGGWAGGGGGEGGRGKLREISQLVVMADSDKLISTLHDPTGTVKAATTRTVLPEVHAQGTRVVRDWNTSKQNVEARSLESSTGRGERRRRRSRGRICVAARLC